MRRSARRIRRRLVVVGIVAGCLAAWIIANAATGRGVWASTGRYVVSLLGRSGPTRDLGRAVSRVAAPTAKRPVTLRVWDWWSASTTEDYARYFGEVERIFEQRHPDVDLIFQAIPFSSFEQKLATGILGGSPPDVFQCSVNWVQGLYDRGMLRELNDFIADTPELQDEQFMPSALYHTRRGERVFGVPHIVDASCLLWNLDILRAEPSLHGMFERKPDGTPDFRRLRFDAVRDWDHFRQIARRLTRDRSQAESAALGGSGAVRQYGFGMSAFGMGAGPFMGWAAANGVRFQDRAGTRALFDTPGAAETLTFLAELRWRDGICPPFRRELTSHGQFEERVVACAAGGTWDGKYLVRDTEGWLGFGMTAFPPGPRGAGPKTLTWANMMVMSSRTRVPEVAWEYMRLICGPAGALLKLKYLNQNSPRLDFYEGSAWADEVRRRPYLSNVKRICESGDPLLHTQTQAVKDEVQPIFEYVLLNWPDIRAGKGRYPGSAEALHEAARRVNLVYERYGKMTAQWNRQLGRPAPEGGR